MVTCLVSGALTRNSKVAIMCIKNHAQINYLTLASERASINQGNLTLEISCFRMNQLQPFLLVFTSYALEVPPVNGNLQGKKKQYFDNSGGTIRVGAQCPR